MTTKENLIITKNIVENYEFEEEMFFTTFLGGSCKALVTDLSQLYDFASYYVPEHIQIMVDKKISQIKVVNLDKLERYKNYQKVYNEYWDTWIINRIKEEFGLEVEVGIHMYNLYRKMRSLNVLDFKKT